MRANASERDVWGVARRFATAAAACGAAAAFVRCSRRGSMDVVERARVPFAFGALGPVGTAREGLRYYDAALASALSSAPRAESALEIGCVKPAFARHLSWVRDKTCVAPYYAGYKTTASDDSVDATDDVRYVVGDFANASLASSYDLCLCMQVLEHLDFDAARDFVRRMLELCRASVVSVPYRWPDCGSTCSHKQHAIDESTLARWSGGDAPATTRIVRERGGGTARAIVVYADD